MTTEETRPSRIPGALDAALDAWLTYTGAHAAPAEVTELMVAVVDAVIPVVGDAISPDAQAIGRRVELGRVYRAIARRIVHMASVSVASQWLLTAAESFDAAAEESRHRLDALLRPETR
jgi:hypothetical protein